jgi:hypothetical protein
MASKVHVQLGLEPSQETALKDLSRRLGVSEAQLIRRASDPGAWQAEAEFIRSLIEQGPVPGGRSWTREELHDR